MTELDQLNGGRRLGRTLHSVLDLLTRRDHRHLVFGLGRLPFGDELLRVFSRIKAHCRV